VEVHHALMDGLHAGRFIQGFEAAMREPLVWLQGTPPA
jgi:chloramphenicol O-acetyltransferase type A